MDQKYLTDSESLSLNIESTYLLLSSPRYFSYEIKMDKYRPCLSMISMFTSDSQHPPRSRHAVHLGALIQQELSKFIAVCLSICLSSRNCTPLANAQIRFLLGLTCSNGLFMLMGEREDPNTTKSRPSSACQRNAIH